IIGGTTTRKCRMANQPRVAKAAYVYPIGAMVVTAPILSSGLADTVNGGRLGNRMLWAGYSRCIGTEDGDAARPEYAAARRPRHLQHIEQPLHIKVPCLLRMFFAAGGKECSQVVDRGRPGVSNQRLECIAVHHIEHAE